MNTEQFMLKIATRDHSVDVLRSMLRMTKQAQGQPAGGNASAPTKNKGENMRIAQRMAASMDAAKRKEAEEAAAKAKAEAAAQIAAANEERDKAVADRDKAQQEREDVGNSYRRAWEWGVPAAATAVAGPQYWRLGGRAGEGVGRLLTRNIRAPFEAPRNWFAPGTTGPLELTPEQMNALRVLRLPANSVTGPNGAAIANPTGADLVTPITTKTTTPLTQNGQQVYRHQPNMGGPEVTSTQHHLNGYRNVGKAMNEVDTTRNMFTRDSADTIAAEGMRQAQPTIDRARRYGQIGTTLTLSPLTFYGVHKLTQALHPDF